MEHTEYYRLKVQRDKFRIEFEAHGYTKQSPWFNDRATALRWASKFWEPEHAHSR